MPLILVATPIGNPRDITLRALDALKECDFILGEEKRVLMPFLKSHGLEKKPVDFLNEHSKPRDVESYVDLCRSKTVCLVSDCGTPGFCDPGADLVSACRKGDIPITALPGASSLMTFLSLTGLRLDQFVFLGFLSADSEVRREELRKVKAEKRGVILMDTPYRLSKLLKEISELIPQRELLFAADLTKGSERIFEGTAGAVLNKIGETKAEFILLLKPIQ